MPNRLISEVIADRKFVAVTSKASVREAAKLMKVQHTSAVLVIDRKEVLVGICTERDIVFNVVAAARDPDHTHVDSVMTEQPVTIGPNKPLGHALHMMFEGRFRHVPVVDSAGRPVGILTAHDALDSDALDFEKDLVRREEITVIL